MSFENLLIRDVEGERSFGRDELPLRVGTGSDCQVRLPGPGGEPVAMLDLLDGLPIVQPVGRSTSLRINDTALEASRRLVDGDVLQFYGSGHGTLVGLGHEFKSQFARNSHGSDKNKDRSHKYNPPETQCPQASHAPHGPPSCRASTPPWCRVRADPSAAPPTPQTRAP